MGLAVEKGPDAFRTISEVAQDLELPQHVLRFWETRFAQIKPLKRGGGRRYYRPDDVDLLRGIRHLLYGDGYTIRGVQQILREQGVRHVQAIGREAEVSAPAPAPRFSGVGRSGEHEARPAGRDSSLALIDLLPSLRSARPTPELPRVVEMPVPHRPAAPISEADDIPAFPFRRQNAAASAVSEAQARVPLRSVTEADSVGPTVRTAATNYTGERNRGSDQVRSSADAVRLLKAALLELGECRRLLDSGIDEAN